MTSAVTTLKILVAGSTVYSQKMAMSLAEDPHFQVVSILTPEAKKVGRRQEIQLNSLERWAKQAKIPVLTVAEKLERQFLAENLADLQLDLILVVDFGYFIPNWLLKLPKIAALNIHPSLLPRWRGSSPGQMVLLTGEKASAITLMKMNAQLDQGDIIWQLPFEVDPSWTAKDYYDQAFALMAPKLADKILAFAQGKIKARAQPLDSPTAIASRLSKNDSFVSWEILTTLMAGQAVDQSTPAEQSSIDKGLLMRLLEEKADIKAQIQLIANASRAFAPWPALWTILPTTKGEQRLKILSAQMNRNNQNKVQQLILNQVQLAGKNPSRFNEIKNLLKK